MPRTITSVIALTETWLAKDTENLYEPSLFNLLHIFKYIFKLFKLYIQNKYDYVQRGNFSKNSEGAATESILAKLSLAYSGQKVAIGSYRPPALMTFILLIK